MNIVTIALTVYALSSLLCNYDGLLGIFYRLRHVKPLQKLLECQACTAMWLFIPFLFFYPPMTVLAAYGLVILAIRYEP